MLLSDEHLLCMIGRLHEALEQACLDPGIRNCGYVGLTLILLFFCHIDMQKMVRLFSGANWESKNGGATYLDFAGHAKVEPRQGCKERGGDLQL